MRKPLYLHAMLSCLRTLLVLLAAALKLVLEAIVPVVGLVLFTLLPGCDIVDVE